MPQNQRRCSSPLREVAEKSDEVAAQHQEQIRSVLLPSPRPDCDRFVSVSDRSSKSKEWRFPEGMDGMPLPSEAQESPDGNIAVEEDFLGSSDNDELRPFSASRSKVIGGSQHKMERGNFFLLKTRIGVLLRTK